MTTAAITVISAHSSTAIVGFDTSILAGRLAPSSMRMYAQDFALYLQFAGYSAELALRPATLARWSTELASNTTQSASTINRRISGVKRLIKEAAVHEFIPGHLAEDFARVRGVKKEALKDRGREHARVWMKPAQVRKIVESPNVATLSGLMHRALLATLAGSGLRISEAVTLTTGQFKPEVDDDGRPGWNVMIRGKNDKDAKPRPLSAEAYGLIQEWLTARAAAGVDVPSIFTGFKGRGDSRLIDKAISPAAAWQMVRRYSTAAGVEHIKPHDFRRFVGSEIYKKKGQLAAQRALGHKRGETTALYIEPTAQTGVTDNLY